MSGWTILRREPRRDDRFGTNAQYTLVEKSIDLRPSCLGSARDYYRDLYLQDDRDGTEILYLGPDGEVHVDMVQRPQPPVHRISVPVTT